MCLLCQIQIPLKGGWILTCIQFGLWVVSAGVFTCSWGRYGRYVEQYMRWALCFLFGACVLTYIVMLGAIMGSEPQLEWAEIVIRGAKDLLVTDYKEVARAAKNDKKLLPIDHHRPLEHPKSRNGTR